jgi:phytanoyl-CoA hydroxylase
MSASVATPGVSEQKAGPRIEVPRILNADQVRAFVENGFLVMPDLVTPDEVEEMRRDIVAVARGRYPCDTLKPIPDSVTDAEALSKLLCIHQPHYVSPVMLKYVKHPRVCGVLGQITGAHLPGWDGSVKCMQSMLFIKPPGFQGQAWHQDEIYIPTRDRSLIGAWIALDDATVENGCLWVLPGSHLPGYLYPQRPHGNEDEFDVTAESWGFDGAREVPVVVKAGSVVFFNGYLLHRSKKNRSANQYRRVLVNHYMNAWSLLPWHNDPQESIARLDSRVIVPVAGIDPYAWKGVIEPPKGVWLRTCKANKPR